MPNGFGVNAAQLRVLVDAQLPPEPARWLTVTYGLAAQHVQDVDQLSTDDSAIVAAARAGDASIVITKDEGFVKLVERFGPPPQIVKVTCGNIRNADLRPSCLARGLEWQTHSRVESRWWRSAVANDARRWTFNASVSQQHVPRRAAA